MITVKVRDNEAFEKAFRRFTKACEKSGLMSEIKKHQHFEKPSEQKKRRVNAAKRKMRKVMAENRYVSQTRSIEQQLLTDMNAALKAGKKEDVATIRMVRAQLKDARIAKGSDLDETDINQVLHKAVKIRKEAIEMYRQGNRQDLVDKESTELGIIQRYMPQQLSADDLNKLIAETISSLNLSSEKDLGRLMGTIMPQVLGKADGKLVQQLAKSALANLSQ
jgi:ribosomal protein S21